MAASYLHNQIHNQTMRYFGNYALEVKLWKPEAASYTSK
jgi:hypothetical protein